MKRERRQKPADIRQLARQAERRYLDRGISRADELTNIRAKTIENLCRALFEVLTGQFYVTENEYDAMARQIDACSRQYREISQQCGTGKAEKWLSEMLGEQSGIDFVLPIIKTPEKARDWQDLACERAAGKLAARFYMHGMSKTLLMDSQKINDVLKAAKERYKAICLAEN